MHAFYGNVVSERYERFEFRSLTGTFALINSPASNQNNRGHLQHVHMGIELVLHDFMLVLRASCWKLEQACDDGNTTCEDVSRYT